MNLKWRQMLILKTIQLVRVDMYSSWICLHKMDFIGLLYKFWAADSENIIMSSDAISNFKMTAKFYFISSIKKQYQANANDQNKLKYFLIDFYVQDPLQNVILQLKSCIGK